MKLKRNKYYIIGFAILTIIIGISFYQYYQNNFAYAKDYYIIKEKCYEGKDKDSKYCSIFKNDKQIEKYIKSADPKKNYKNQNAITTTCEIVELYFYSNLQLFSPMIIAIVVVGTFHSTFTSGNFKNYLLRMNYKQYLKKVHRIVLKSALIIPISLVLVFIISMFITNFNFDVTSETVNNAVYGKWKYSHFALYGFLICLIQYIISLLYGKIAIISCVKNKNSLIAVIMSYIMFVATYLFIYLILYAIIINRILGFKELTDYFNIVGYGSLILLKIVYVF